MKDMEKIITGILIIAFFGWLIMDNCCSDGKSCAGDLAESEETQCGEDCAKACCLGCKATDGDAKCKEGHSCCDLVSEKIEDNENDSTDVTDSTEADETLTEEDNTEEKLDDGEEGDGKE